MQGYLLDLGEGIIIRGSQFTALIPKWLMDTDGLQYPEGTPDPTCYVELEGGRVVPCFKPMSEMLEFLTKVAGPQTGGW